MPGQRGDDGSGRMPMAETPRYPAEMRGGGPTGGPNSPFLRQPAAVPSGSSGQAPNSGAPTWVFSVLGGACLGCSRNLVSVSCAGLPQQSLRAYVVPVGRHNWTVPSSVTPVQWC